MASLLNGIHQNKEMRSSSSIFLLGTCTSYVGLRGYSADKQIPRGRTNHMITRFNFYLCQSQSKLIRILCVQQLERWHFPIKSWGLEATPSATLSFKTSLQNYNYPPGSPTSMIISMDAKPWYITTVTGVYGCIVMSVNCSGGFVRRWPTLPEHTLRVQ